MNNLYALGAILPTRPNYYCTVWLDYRDCAKYLKYRRYVERISSGWGRGLVVDIGCGWFWESLGKNGFTVLERYCIGVSQKIMHLGNLVSPVENPQRWSVENRLRMIALGVSHTLCVRGGFTKLCCM